MWWDENWDVELLMMKEWFEKLRLWNWNLLNWDWIDEKCELLVFDSNELIVLNGWLICGKPRKKRWDWKHMLYDEMRNWAMWNCTKWLILKKMPRKGKDWYWKRCPERENDWYEKDAQKGKRLNWKRCPEREKIEMKNDAQLGKECDEKDKKWFTYY